MKKLFLFFLVIIFSSSYLFGEDKIEIGIDEQLGKKLPLNTTFTDENGSKVLLKDLFTKPTVLAFVYYECPSICSPLLGAVADIVQKSDLIPGEDYNIITISIDEREDFYTASDKKRNFLHAINKNIPENSWKFLTGDSSSIRTVTDAAGFYFKREGTQFIHSGAIIFANNDGKITRYLFPDYRDDKGYSILPFDFKMAVIETSKGNVTPTIAKVLQFCFSYDPAGKSYVLNFTRIFGAGILFLAAIFVVYLTVKPKKQIENKGKSL